MSRLTALIIGVATAQPDIDAACRRPTWPDRYVVMLSAFEQMNKNIDDRRFLRRRSFSPVLLLL